MKENKSDKDGVLKSKNDDVLYFVRIRTQLRSIDGPDQSGFIGRKRWVC
jgi:hypothetical protein